MPDQRPSRRKTHLAGERPPFERIALILQVGGALGSYQAGVYQALAEANLHPDWVAGISIGAVNSALIAGNPPERRVDRLREFWEAVSTSPFGLPYFASHLIDDAVDKLVVDLIGRSLRRCARVFQAASAASLLLSERQPRGPQLLRRRPAESDARTLGGF